MKRYYEDGTLLAIQYFYKNSEYSYTKLFYNNGHIAAEGKYINTLKDSTWRYYSFYDKTLRLEENYTKGKKQGVSTKYYPNGKPAEIITWKDDIKNGQWLQFFENGQLKLKAFYINDKRSGDFNTYWPNGKNETIGKFENNLMEGEWKYFDEEGNQKIKVIYKNGVAQNPEAIEKAQKEIFELIEKNKGKIPEPKEEDLLPMQ